MRRTDTHIIETESKRIFEGILPSEWALNKLELDYGIDFMIEIFDTYQYSTGKFLFIQLKGSRQKIVNNTFKIQFDINNLKDYAAQPLPLLIICVSVTEKKVWAIWANKLLQSLKVSKDQKSVTIKLDANSLVDANFFRGLLTKIESVHKIGVSVSHKGDIGKRISQNISNFIEYYFGNTFVINDPHLPQHFYFDFSEGDEKCVITIKGPFYQDVIEVFKDSEIERILMRPVFDKSDINVVNSEILKSIVKAFLKEDIRGSLELLRTIVVNDCLTDVKHLFDLNPSIILQLSIQHHLIGPFNEIAKLFIKKGLIEIYSIIDILYFSLDKKNNVLNNYRIENMEAIIKECANDSQKGAIYYNLGNALRGLGEKYLAVSYYLKARKLEEDYVNRDYWWRELAGLMFESGHYRYAELFYKRSIGNFNGKRSKSAHIRFEKSNYNLEILTYVLIGDCLFFQGKFIEATEWISKYQKTKGNHYDGFALKKWICKRLIDLGLDNVTLERKVSMLIVEKSYNTNEDVECQIERLEEAIKKNPTNNLAWFNLGVSQQEKGSLDQAFYSFLTAGLLNTGDKEACFNSLLIAILHPGFEMYLLPLIHYLKELYGDMVVNDLSDFLMNQSVSLKQKRFLVENLTTMFQGINLRA